ncbi:Hsp33 family molecular chaperone HslO [Bombilactobacillus folatiphilus]|uniref:33 kDa chaperonin n=1 Tax=Bombilactobacillus folatiphilus TaxID=2923362 RepID=A0ABY4P9C1_9LACO|nr:Hsp33 family molecular chaperone HslO [Bombilactobacillus folatiphilus]UQS82339.1 Hsp33 family molecular chaperone HslO [Bombilactobacillus folatiphilus]
MDYLVKSLNYNSHFRIYVVNATQLVATAQSNHDTWSASSAALGRSLIGTLLLSTSMLKNDELMTTRINGGGPVGLILADGNAQGQVKGYIQNPHISLPLNAKGKIDVAKAVGQDGVLAVTKDQKMAQPFTGKVPLISGELAEDYAYYLVQSEQIPAAVGLSVFVESDNHVSCAGGFMVQALPNAQDGEIDTLTKTIQQLPPLHELFQQYTPEEIVNLLFTQPAKILERMPVEFQCDCSQEHFAQTLRALPKSELQELAQLKQDTEIVCKFCGQKYQFTPQQFQQMILEK